jgi:high-affinity nickel-transport protein
VHRLNPSSSSGWSGTERRRLSAFGAGVIALHLLGWGLFSLFSGSYPELGGLGALAYTLGLRHAFDADHIAAIDNTTRKLLHDGKRPLGVGFFFSLGHATVVLLLTAALVVGSEGVNSSIPALQSSGKYIGASVSGTFLWIIGILNLLVLADIARTMGKIDGASFDRERLEQGSLTGAF